MSDVPDSLNQTNCTYKSNRSMDDMFHVDD